MLERENEHNVEELPSANIDNAQTAEEIYNVKGDINNYISIFNSTKNDDRPNQLKIMRERLEEKKQELYTATQKCGANSKDAKNIANDAGIYRDQIEALKSLIATDTDLPIIISSRLDMETVREAFFRFKQRDDNIKRQEEQRQAIEQEKLRQEEERIRQEEERIRKEQKYNNSIWRKISRFLSNL